MRDGDATAFELLLAARSAETYADFFLPHLRSDACVLDLGCGRATITMGIAGAVPRGRVVGVDVDGSGFAAAHQYAASTGPKNVAFGIADGRSLPFDEAAFDASWCHSVLEAVERPAAMVGELRRVTRPGGVVGAASVDYGGLIIAGKGTEGVRRFYEIRVQLWGAAGLADPFMGRRLRGLFEQARFTRVEAFADYVSHGTTTQVLEFGRARAAECRDEELHTSVARYRIASRDELLTLATVWEEWSRDAEAFLAFPWCRVLGWT